MWDVVQVIGALLVLAGFLAAQFRLLDERSYGYLVPNIVGSAALAVTAVISNNWGFVLLESVWCLASLWALRTLISSDRSKSSHTTGQTP